MDATLAGRDLSQHPTIRLMGLKFAAISERQTIAHVLDALASGQGGWLSTVNLDILRQWNASPEMRELLAGADLVVADGMPLVWAGELQSSPLPERVAGSSLIMSLTAAAAEAGARVFLLGGNPGTAEAAAKRLDELTSEATIVGTLCPPFGFENDPHWHDRIERALREAAPDIVFVGLGFPKQEQLIVRLHSLLPHTWFVPCGISFSFVSGEVHRAPPLVQRFGLEWLHRMAQEPKRLWRRYLFHDVPFLSKLLWSALRRRLSSEGDLRVSDAARGDVEGVQLSV